MVKTIAVILVLSSIFASSLAKSTKLHERYSHKRRFISPFSLASKASQTLSSVSMPDIPAVDLSNPLKSLVGLTKGLNKTITNLESSLSGTIITALNSTTSGISNVIEGPLKKVQDKFDQIANKLPQLQHFATDTMDLFKNINPMITIVRSLKPVATVVKSFLISAVRIIVLIIKRAADAIISFLRVLFANFTNYANYLRTFLLKIGLGIVSTIVHNIQKFLSILS